MSTVTSTQRDLFVNNVQYFARIIDWKATTSCCYQIYLFCFWPQHNMSWTFMWYQSLNPELVTSVPTILINLLAASFSINKDGACTHH